MAPYGLLALLSLLFSLSIHNATAAHLSLRQTPTTTTTTTTTTSSNAAAEVSADYGTCTQTVLPIAVVAPNLNLTLTPPANQQVLTDFFVRLTSDPQSVLDEVVRGTQENRATYNIHTVLCVPKTQDGRGTAELAVAGIGFDHTYWTLGGPNSQYNYAEAALRAGHAILMYDRLGVGRSDTPDGIKEVQTPTQVEIAAELAKYLYGLGYEWVVGVGHSYGSVTLDNLAMKYGNLLNATVITGLTSHTESNLPALATWSLTIASEDDPQRLGSLPSEYTVWHGIINNQQNFFAYPNYESAILQLSEDTKYGATIGEWITMAAPPAPLYTNPVLVVTGDKDYIACTANCLQLDASSGLNLVEATRELFPNTTSYATYIPPNTGHGVNAHLNAQETFGKIQEWIAGLA